MIEVELTFEDGTQRRMQAVPPLLFGRDNVCQVQIRHWRVGRKHMRVDWAGESRDIVSSQPASGRTTAPERTLVLEDLGTLAGTTVNNRRVARHSPVLPDDVIVLGPCRIRLRSLSSADIKIPAVIAEPTIALSDATVCYLDTNPVQAIENIEVHDTTETADAWRERCRSLQDALIAALDLRRRDVAAMNDDALRAEATQMLETLVASEASGSTELERRRLCTDVLNEALGLGPLEPLLHDASISEIMVNRYDQIYVERSGRLMRHPTTFSSDQAVLSIIDRIVAPIGRRIDESSPMVDARLSDGSRVNAVIPPIAIKGPSLTIRKFPQRRLAMQDLVNADSLDAHMAQFLTLCVQQRKNIVVAGGTGSGKTTLLNILSNSIPDG